MTRQSKNARNRILAKQVTAQHLTGERYGKRMNQPGDKGRSQARRMQHFTAIVKR